MPPIQFVTEYREAGQTLAAVLKKRYNLSWAQSKRLIEGRHIRVSGHVEIDVTRRVKTGKAVTIDAGAIDLKSPGTRRALREQKAAESRDAKKEAGKPPRPTAASAKAAAAKAAAAKKDRPKRPADPLLSPDILVYVDDAVVVVNKPAGLTTMRHEDEAAEFGEHGRRFLTKTLSHLLPALLGAPTHRLTAVHRLDRDTSGLVVFARTPAAAAELTTQFRKHTTDRRYVALTRGTPKAGRVESVLVRDRSDGRRGSTHKSKVDDGKKAVTYMKVLEELGAFALVECRLETGRTHQVRIHLGEVGTPLCGEKVYDRAVNSKPLADGSGAARPMLHAARLGFKHPETGEAMKWEVAPPEDFAALLGRLRKGEASA